jgi:two-component system sensor histidine kinase KdpD
MQQPARPDPDELIAQMRADEERARRGKLRIYFGANAGVGKTWAMLSAAQRARQAGRDVLVGVVETHGRADTEALLAGLEQLPRRAMPYRGRMLDEFDLDAALARRPAVILVDELAHSNVEGSRHAKRWQDIEELQAAGIEVWTALNVQHLESLNGTVGAITGVRVQETVPDAVLDEAEEVVLVDATPDELTARLAAGKVYVPPQAERAVQNFFRKGNLIALREIALRRTAEHVEDDVRGWRVEQSSSRYGVAAGAAPLAAWNTSGQILACVGPHEDAAQTVRSAARLAGQLNVNWHAAYVETPRLQRLPAAERDRILAVLALAEELGAGTAVLTGDDVARTLAAEARRLNCATVVLGRPKVRGAWHRWWPSASDIAGQLARQSPTLDIVTTGTAGSSRRLPRAPLGSSSDDEGDADRPRAHWPGYALAAAASVLLTLLALPLAHVLEGANIVMLYLLGVVGVALRFGRGPAAFAAMLNVAAFDFFFVDPRLSFSVSDWQYLLTFAVMSAVGLLIGQLTAGLRFAAGVSASRERRAQSLFELTRELSAALQAEQVVAIGANAVQRHFGGPALVLATDEGDRLAVPANPPAGFDASVADWAFRHGQPAGLATATLSAQRWHYVPLKAPMRVRGVLALQPARARWLLIPEQMQQLDTQARQIAIALERVHYVDVAQRAVVEIESERLRNALLGAISHDVRTPLTALIALAESLQGLPEGREAEAARAIVAQAHELNALVGNLLDMARLESGVAGGAVNLRREWQSVEETVGAAILSARTALGGLAVQTRLPPDLPLVEFDAVLIERVLVNLLENAAKYGAPPIVVSARATEGALVLAVRDHGPGLPARLKGREHTLFDKFTRGQAESATPGVGLGLAICKAVVSAHGGEIAAANATDGDGRGAEFTVTLPRRTPPETIES